jgi:hypothetical protein
MEKGGFSHMTYIDATISALLDPKVSTIQGVIDWENGHPFDPAVLGTAYLDHMREWRRKALLIGVYDRGNDNPMDTEAGVLNRVMGLLPLPYIDVANVLYSMYIRGYGE